MDVRTRLRAAIGEKGTSARAVSLDAGLSDSMVHKFLTGATNSLTFETLNKIADALEVDRIWLAYGEGDPEPASEVTDIWNRIAEQDRETALRVLEGFVKTGTDG
jgi:transcriptional regulator with XRE-family HTH domain